MANPNLLTATSALGNTTAATPSASVTTVLLTNAASSGQVYKINRISITNYSGSSGVMQVIWDGNPIYYNTVINSTTEFAVTKTTGFYLLENKSITVRSPFDFVTFVVSYEIIS
jgi:hypothetical protein